MPSERVQRQIDQLLDEAELAIRASDWALVRSRCGQVLALDPGNADAPQYLAAADRSAGLAASSGASPEARHPSGAMPSAAVHPSSPPLLPQGEKGDVTPTSFAAGRYQVKRFLGEGGKKRVYLAHDTTLDRDVAFALIKTEGLDQTARERVSREAQAMGRLGSHPHIVTVFDLGEEPFPHIESQSAPSPSPARGGDRGEVRGQPYMVTELMGGGDVEALIEKAPEHKLPLPRALAIAEQVCQGLEFAHGKGIVHRDLKPGNVWLTADGVAKIGDFGLAVAIDRSRLTQAGMMVGTVSYMPPEQATGGAVTPRSDLYSLGAMLYEMVAGRPPFVGDESVAIIGQHLNTPPVAPTWHRSDCPPGLETLILRLLEKDPSKRPASAAEVRQALESVAARDLTPLPPSLGGKGEDEGDSPPHLGEGLGERSGNPLYRRVFVGREVEMRQLQAAFDAALSGKGALAMVVGEPGIGKTAICEQLATYVTLRGGTTLTGHCYEEGSLSLPYLAFVEAVRSYAISRSPEALRQELGTAASDLARIVSEVRERLAVEPRPPGDPEEDRWRLLQAVSGFLRNASAVQPLLLVLEDLHWADQGTLDLLQHLARNLLGARLLVVGTYRDVEVDRGHPLSATLAELRRGAEFGRVLLRGLGTPEVQRMLLAITGSEAPGSLAESIHRQTEGNPLFVQEVVRYLVEEGHLSHGSVLPSPYRGGAGGEVTAAAMSIPEGLRDVIGRRLSRLSPNCNRVLAVASVIGRDFGLETLHAVVELDEEQVVSSLEEALKIGVLEESASGRPGLDIRYRFAHAFFRQTLYEELIAPRRLRLHQQVAAALERQYANRLDEHASELAEHFAQSTDRDDLAKAVRYGELGAQRALAVYAYGEAVRHLEQALAVQEVLDPDDKAKRCDLLLALAKALLPAGEPARVFETVAPQALALAEELKDSGRAGTAGRLALEGLNRYGNVWMAGTAVYRQWAKRADRYAAAGTIGRVDADLALAQVCVGDGRLAEVLPLREGALALARQLGDPGIFSLAALSVLACMWQSPAGQQSEESVLRLTDELCDYPREGVPARTLGNVLHWSGIVYLNTGARARAQAVWHELAELAQRTQDADLLLSVLATEFDELLLDGELETAVAAATRIGSRGEELGAPVTGRVWAATHGFRPLLYLSRAEEAIAALSVAGQLAGLETEQALTSWITRTRMALVLACLGRSDEAQAAMNQLLAEQRVAGRDHRMETSSGVVLLETAVLLRDRQATALLASRLRTTASLAYGSLAKTCVARHLGAASVLLDKQEEARRYYEQAIEICERVRFRPELALTRLELAELLLAHYPDERAAAIDHLDFAIAEFREMKMQPSLERALGHKEVLKA